MVPAPRQIGGGLEFQTKVVEIRPCGDIRAQAAGNMVSTAHKEDSQEVDTRKDVEVQVDVLGPESVVQWTPARLAF